MRQAGRLAVARGSLDAIRVVLLGLAFAGAVASVAEGSDASEGILPVLDYRGDLGSRSTLTGDWAGWRGRLAENGVSVALDFTTMLPQSIVDGGRNRKTQVGTSMDLGINIDLMRMGLIPGGLLYMRVEGDFGESVNSSVGAFTPVNVSALLPVGTRADQRATISDLYYTQFLGERFGIFAGRFDTLKDANTMEFGGGGLRTGKAGFLNGNFAVQQVYPTTTPYVTAFGGGALFMANENLVLSALVLDKAESSLSGNLGSLGDDGWNLTFSASGTYDLLGLPGGTTLVGTYAWDADFTTVGGGQLLSIRSGLGPLVEDTSWNVTGSHWQYVHVFEDDVPAASSLDLGDGRPDLRGWGVFLMWGVADKDTNPFPWTFAAGVGGKGIIPGRDKDVFGVGYFYNKVAQGGIIDRSIGLRSGEQGFEIYYEVEVTPWLHLTPDLQVIQPGVARNDAALVLGLRALLDF